MVEIVVVVLIVVKLGVEEKLCVVFEGIVELICNEVGVLQYDLYWDLKEFVWFVFVECWESEEVLVVYVCFVYIFVYCEVVVDWIECFEICVLLKFV